MIQLGPARNLIEGSPPSEEVGASRSLAVLPFHRRCPPCPALAAAARGHTGLALSWFITCALIDCCLPEFSGVDASSQRPPQPTCPPVSAPPRGPDEYSPSPWHGHIRHLEFSSWLSRHIFRPDTLLTWFPLPTPPTRLNTPPPFFLAASTLLHPARLYCHGCFATQQVSPGGPTKTG